MDTCVARVLGTEDAGRVAQTVSLRRFSDGLATAQGFASEVKNNLQLLDAGADRPEPGRIIVAALERTEAFQVFTFPRRIAPVMFNRYEVGMSYGRHVDAAMMGGHVGLRTDFSVTVFLSPPESYDGGELVIDTPMGEQAIKLDAGEAVLYPGNTIHHVAPVTRGVRLAAVTWVQSTVRDSRLRVVLADLHRALIHAQGLGDADLSLRLTKVYQDIIRYAAES